MLRSLGRCWVVVQVGPSRGLPRPCLSPSTLSILYYILTAEYACGWRSVCAHASSSVRNTCMPWYQYTSIISEQFPPVAQLSVVRTSVDHLVRPFVREDNSITIYMHLTYSIVTSTNSYVLQWTNVSISFYLRTVAPNPCVASNYHVLSIVHTISIHHYYIMVERHSLRFLSSLLFVFALFYQLLIVALRHSYTAFQDIPIQT